MHILITGGAGFIGSAMATALAKKENYRVTVVDDLSTGDMSNLHEALGLDLHFIKANVNGYEEMASIFSANQFDYIFHYAAVVGVKRTLNRPIDVLEDIHGFENILKLSKNTGVKRVFFASSSEVYGEPVEIPQHEQTTPLNSRLPYAIVKNVGEAYLRSFQQEYGLEYTIFRFFNTYGCNQSRDFVISKFLDAAVRGHQITIYGDGSQTRTFLHIDDNVEACIKIMENGLFINDVVNVGCDKVVNMVQLAEAIKKVTASNSELIHLPALEEGDMTRRQPDISRFRSVLGREPISLEQGLKIIFNKLSSESYVRN